MEEAFKRMPLGHLRKVITSLFLKNIQKCTQASADNRMYYCQPWSRHEILLLSLSAVTFFLPWEKSPSPLFAKRYPFCKFRSIFLSPFLPKEDWLIEKQTFVSSVSRDFLS